MAKGTFDGANKLFIVDLGVSLLDVQVDLYSDWKEWVRLSDNSKFLPMFRTVGGDSTGADAAIGRYFFLMNGWKIRPQEADHTLTVDGNILVEGGVGSPFVQTVGSFNVLINTIFSNLTSQVFTGGGGYSSTDRDMMRMINAVIRGNALFTIPTADTKRIQFLDGDGNVIETHDIAPSGRTVT